MAKNRKNKGGRPTVITKEVLQKLEEAFELDYTDKEACLHADISTSTLYNYQQKNPKFLERKAQLKLKLNVHARQVINDALENGDVKTARWYLERKAPEEYSLKRIHKRLEEKEPVNEKVTFVYVD